MTIKYINIFQSEALTNFSQIGIFGLKTNHLATLERETERERERETERETERDRERDRERQRVRQRERQRQRRREQKTNNFVALRFATS
jgi:hypothetical protein